jgi:uncharacterized protein (TIGR01777 family)
LLQPLAIGFYGDRGSEILSEETTQGQGFLAEVCRDWETEIQKNHSPDTRVTILRLGVVLGENGGALEQMVAPFSFGLGATLGSGNQWMSWIHLDDVIEGLCFALNKPVKGIFNLVAPDPVTTLNSRGF